MLTLKADDLPRFMTCNGYRLMPHNAPFNVDDSARDEGNAAHWMVQQIHSGKLTFQNVVGQKAFNGVFITDEMVEFAIPYLDAIMGKGEVECETSYGDNQRYQINARADHIEYDQLSDTLFVDDFKYGWGIIEPENNWTLISHAIGFIHRRLNGHFPARVVLRIFQPRPHHPEGKIREHVYDAGKMRDLFEYLIHTLCNPRDELRTSEHCRKCPALATCPAAIKAGMNAVDVSERPFVADLDDATLGFMLDQIDRSMKILEQNKKAYSEKALHRLKAGGMIPGYTRETELTNRQWKEGITVDTVKVLTGKDLAKKQLITPAQAVKHGLTEDAVNALTERREKGSKLVRLDADKAAKKMFGNLNKGAK